MSYELTRLDSEEFEELAADIVGRMLGVRVELYKKGKDQGIDGKFTTSNGEVGIIQAKHWAKSTYSALIKHIQDTEAPKAQKLSCDKYIFVTSQELSHKNKLEIIKAFGSKISSTSDIIACNEIVSFLKNNNDIERKHYKLWLSSANIVENILSNDVLGESEFTLSEIYEQSKLYYPTRSHSEAIKKIEDNSVVIITGEPGIGKTTLAKNICLYYVGQGYHLIDSGKEIKNASRLFSHDEDAKQIFYYDDFLGKNIINVLDEKEDSSIVNFINRIKRHKNAKFILTSRSNILNSRKFEVEIYDDKKVYKNEYEIKINNVSDYEKARILYSHMYHSSIQTNYLREILKGRFYRRIVQHKNFSPRIIEYLLDEDRVTENNIDTTQYQTHILNSLDSPSSIWDRCFEGQNYVLKKIIMLIAFYGRDNIGETALKKAYDTLMSLDAKAKIESNPDNFNDCIRILSNSMISRIVFDSYITYTTYNPSINDYLIKKYKSDTLQIADLFICYDQSIALHNLMTLYKNDIQSLKVVIDRIMRKIDGYRINKEKSYIENLINLSIEINDKLNKHSNNYATNWLSNIDYSLYTPTHVAVFNKSLLKIENKIAVVPSFYQINYLKRCIENSSDVEDLESVSLLIDKYELEGNEILVNQLSTSLDDILHDSFPDMVYDNRTLDDFLPDNEFDAEIAVEDLLNSVLSQFLPSVCVNEISILGHVDISSTLESNAESYYYEETYEERRTPNNHSNSEYVDDIDDMFDGFGEGIK